IEYLLPEIPRGEVLDAIGTGAGWKLVVLGDLDLIDPVHLRHLVASKALEVLAQSGQNAVGLRVEQRWRTSSWTDVHAVALEGIHGRHATATVHAEPVRLPPFRWQ